MGSARSPVPDEVDLAGLRLTVAAVARRLGVAPATLRTWDRRYGLGPSEHSSGSHRRYAPEDVARLELMQRGLVEGASPAEAARIAVAATAPVDPAGPVEPPAGAPTAGGPDSADPPVDLFELALAEELDATGGADRGGGGSVLRLPGAGREARGLARAALALDSDAAQRLLWRSLVAVGVTRTWDEVARPVLGSVSDRWLRTGAGVEVEHLLAEVVTAVMARVVLEAAPPVSARPVVLGAMPGDEHSLPLRVLAATLAERGVGTRLLGASLPGSALGAAIIRTAPAAVFLWSQLPATADVAVLEQLPRTRPRTRCYVGGPGWDLDALPPAVVALGTLGEAGNVLTAAAGL